MTSFRLNRRAVLRGMGSIAVALPWLEIMQDEKNVARAQAAGTPAGRFLSVYQPGGTVTDRFWPTASNPSSSPILAPLQPIEHKILVLDGLELKCAVGEQHQAGIVGWLTGAEQGSSGAFPATPSIDQVIATRLSQTVTRKLSSVQMAVRWATGKSHGLLHPINAVNFEDSADAAPIPPRLDPVQIWNDLFGTLDPNVVGADAQIERKKSILDFVDRKYETLAARLGTADKAKLDQHLTKIREIEMSLDVMVMGGGRCVAPTQLDTTGYNPTTGLDSADDGTILDASTDELIPAVGKYMMDMMVMAMACDITAVGSFQWTDTEAKHTFPWLGLMNHHHYYQHDGGFSPTECEQIARWYSEQHSYLLQEMDKVDMGGHTLLDESVVFFGTELADPPSHSKLRMPFILAGLGGGLRSGRHVVYESASHNDLLVAILNLFGDPRTSYGAPQHTTGPLGDLI